ncbi:hypothetical protein CK203_026722 [Vitis vinifera]|uniref:Myb-like domain-containing protein n=1 Tax=Vitis vinifera TaxID=29760 RepID=A0A438IUW4_VITVI|nr:hypothetical protein CK203_026722 [Vitis vinifera]
MEFLDEESRPRFVFQSGSNHSPASTHLHPQPLNKPLIFISLSLSSILIPFPSSSSNLNPSNLSSSGSPLSPRRPFAPSHLTGRRYPGRPWPNPRIPLSRAGFRMSSTRDLPPIGDPDCGRVEKRSEAAAEESEWVDGDVEILKKQLLKHPVGMPGRWEAVAEAFRGRHGVESVIRKAKSLGRGNQAIRIRLIGS